MELLKPFDPVLAGTIPLGIDVEGSDLDILCEVDDFNSFIAIIVDRFGPRVSVNYKWLPDTHGEYLYEGVGNGQIIDVEPELFDDLDFVTVGFMFGGFEFEVFGQNLPVTQQNGYRHMINEWKILQREGETFRQEIIRLKKTGMKTEPAFAWLLGLDGDPYKAILDYRF